MELRVISDIHVNFYDNAAPVIDKLNQLFPKINPDKEILIIPGDIGQIVNKNNQFDEKYYDVLKYLKSRWKYIIIVAGNHEYYGCQNMSYASDLLTNICEKMGIEFLNKDSVEMFDYTFIGCTLWSNLNKDYWNEIEHKYSSFTDCESLCNLHKNNVEWLDKTLDKYKNKKVVVITHHLPSKKLISGHFNHSKYDISNTCYYSNLDWIIKKYSKNMIYWFCGHSHISELMVHKKTIIYLNPLGNPKDFNKQQIYKDTLPISGIHF